MKPDSPMPPVMTKEQVAEILMISARQVRRLIADHKLRGTRLGHKTLRIRREDLERFLERNTT